MPRRPVTMPDLKTLEKLARLGITQQELADLCSCSQPTISAKLAREPYKSVWRRGQAEMKVSVRRNLLRLTDEGNVAAAIFCAKAVLGMQEPPRDTRVTNEISGNVKVRYLAEWATPTGELEVPEDEVIEGEADEE